MNTSGKTIRVLLADDHPTTRAGIRAILDGAADIEVVGEARDGIEAKQLAAELHPDILLLDLVMPGPRPAEIERWVRTHCPETITLVLTAHDRSAYLAEMIEAGVAGYLIKSEPAEGLIAAIRGAAGGEVLLSREQFARARRWREEVGEKWESLTRRERQVLALIVEGQSNQQIAQALTIKERTVETHIGNLLRKLGLASRAKAITWALRHGVLDEMDAPG